MRELDRNYYLEQRQRYLPTQLRLAIIAESPPASGLYFYDAEGSVGEPLFRELMKQAAISAGSKEVGLRAFQKKGWILVDSTYKPVDKIAPNEKFTRDDIIKRDYPVLKDDLRSICANQSVPLILIKANVCKILEPLLLNDGFRVLNRGTSIPFPSTGWQTEFRKRFASIANDVL